MSKCRALLLLALVVLVAGASSWAPVARADELPADPAAAAVYRDLQRIVDVHAARGWWIDRVEVQAVLPDALETICRVSPATREATLHWLDGRITELGGPVETAYAQRAHKLSAVDDLLELTRVRKLLIAGIAAAPDDCPFWIDVDPHFTGLQIADDRWQLQTALDQNTFGLYSGGTVDVQGGGAARLVLSRNWGAHWGVGVGALVGATAEFPPAKDGVRGQLLLGLEAIAPVVVRWRRVNSYVELEAGPRLTVSETAHDPIPGLHVAATFGLESVREGWFTPGVGFSLAWEQTFPDVMGLQPVYYIKFALRVSADLDL